MSTLSTSLNFTDSAAAKVSQLIQEEGNPKLNLRVFITGGGCSGFQYGFTFDEAVNQDDIVIEKKITSGEFSTVELLGLLAVYCSPAEYTQPLMLILVLCSLNDNNTSVCVKLLVDPMSFQYLVGAKIDYREDDKGAQFVIGNPNAKTTCGCGSSFAA